MEDNNSFNNEGTYYSPNVNIPEQKPKKKLNGIVAIIITVIVCSTVVAVVVIGCIFYWFSGNFKMPDMDTSIVSDGYSTVVSDDMVQIDPAEISNIKVVWVNGNINIQYYDGDKVTFSESGRDDNFPMTYEVNNNTLYIGEYKNGAKINSVKTANKDLNIDLPQDFKLNNIEFEVVNSNVNINEINADTLDVESVSAQINVKFINQPSKIEIETVSGDANITLPEDITGYVLDMDSISGKFKNSGNFANGDKAVKIDFESVSGNLFLNK